MKQLLAELAIPVIFVSIAIVFVPCSWVFKSHMEAKAYNSVTGANVTTWEAMWIELRVQESSVPRK